MVVSGAGASAAPPAPLTSLQAIAALTNAQASQHLPVNFEATVTYYGFRRVMFVQDGEAAIYVGTPADLNLVPGDRVLVRGEVRPSFRPYVVGSEVKFLSHGSLPKAIYATFDQMIRAETDCRLVTVRATVRAADWELDPRFAKGVASLRLLVEGEIAEAITQSDDPNAFRGLLGAEVEITGVASGQFDNKMQQTGVLFHLQSPGDVKVLKRAEADPWSIPVTPMDRVIVGRRIADSSERMRVRGVVTYYEPGDSVVLQDGKKSIRVLLGSTPEVHVGDLADAIGYPDVQNGFLTLTQGEVRDDGIPSEVTPVLANWKDLTVGGNDGTSHVFDIVSIEGQVVTEVRQATQDEYVLEGDGHLFSAILRHPSPVSAVPVPPMQLIPIGARIRVTGICMLADANPFNGEVPFNIVMRSIGDVEILKRPPWLNVTHLLYLVAVLLVVIVVVGARGWFIEHRTRHKTTAMAHIEQRRGRILEDVNSSRPLAEILEQITALVSFELRGAPCWCEIAGGATLGNRPNGLESVAWQVKEQAIPSHSGAPLGTIFAALPARAPGAPEVSNALAQAAALASLAIETSRLHLDLVHRSEFDQLTDVRNRFSLERGLDQMIALARQSAGMFGMIYIDLNEFKLVNDRYGHQAGDIYLQQVARRMKRQLRPGDTLARLGGDEFAVIVSTVRNRAEVEEIALRLERCFDEPFAIEGYEICGSASVGMALYPQDATSRDGLLSAADTAMYAAKNARRKLAVMLDGHAEPAKPPEHGV
jgi:diguanylate cyclase (GGDEF)-like protein